jgi:1,4-dihydroxy-2-naphthoate octaprenyltransferase
MKKWLMVIRAPFLLLPIVLALLGSAIAWYWYKPPDTFNVWYAVLAFVGILLAHVSVNVLNEYFDYRSGVDLRTQRTPFSGGSGALPQELLTPRQALWLGVGSLVIIVPLGIYFTVVTGLALLPLLIVAAALVIFYTPVILKMGWPEWAPGVGLGSLPVLGAFFIQTGEYTLPAVIASIPSGILVHNLLLLNEFPDVEADKSANRRTLPIVIGKRKAALFYSAMTILVYLWIIGWVIAGEMPAFSLLGLLTLPLAARAILGSMKYDDMSKLGPAMAANVMVILLTQLLMGIGYILAKVVGG